jgi:GNAT superfamily N-acetyltransferase
MRPNLTGYTPSARIRANRTNLYELFRNLENSSFMDFSNMEGFSRWSCALPHTWFNAILCSRDATPADGAFIDESLAYFKAKNTNSISLWLENDVSQAGWEAVLLPRGFTLQEGPRGMSVDLERLAEPGKYPEQMEIRIVADEKGMEDCAEMIVAGYEMPDSWRETTQQFVKGIGLNTPYRSYVAYWEGKPVSTAAVLFGKDVAGIYTVATAPEARGKGLGTAVTLAPLLDARKMGYRVGTLQASEMGFPVYKKMGFQEDYRASSFYRKI